MSEWLTWQVVDSALPTGLFAHSWGLESAWQHGEVHSLEALREFVDASVLQSGHAVLPFVNAAFRSPERLEALDGVAEAFLTNAVANRASRIQGRTLIATAGRVWPSAALTALKARADAMHAHVAPLSGATFRALALPLQTVQKVVFTERRAGSSRRPCAWASSAATRPSACSICASRGSNASRRAALSSPSAIWHRPRR